MVKAGREGSSLQATLMRAAGYANDVITNVAVGFGKQTSPVTIIDTLRVDGNVQNFCLHGSRELAVLY